MKSDKINQRVKFELAVDRLLKKCIKNNPRIKEMIEEEKLKIALKRVNHYQKYKDKPYYQYKKKKKEELIINVK